MAQFTSTERVLPHEILDRFNWEVPTQAGSNAQDCERVGGRIGGRMVRVALRHAEEAVQIRGAHL